MQSRPPAHVLLVLSGTYLSVLYVLFQYLGGSKLVQVAEYRLHGNVESMEKVQLAQSKRESLLLSFRDAKVSRLVLKEEVRPRTLAHSHIPNSLSCRWWSGTRRSTISRHFLFTPLRKMS